MKFSIPGRGDFDIQKVIFDLNGTLTIDGKVIEGVPERIQALRQRVLALFLFTGDTQGNGATIAKELGLELKVTGHAQDKANEARELESEHCAAIGNGSIDIELFKTVKFPMAVRQAEGSCPKAEEEALIVFPSILDALDALLQEPPKRIIATLRR
ncbi:haloacid dehalogenase [Candidatus Peregrinibacteria bacterium]|nr:haloacid dehalogenase [Candidatus Peregrinibacteria bacterium]